MDTFEELPAQFEEANSLFETAIKIDEKHFPRRFVKEFWAFFNEDATTSIISDEEMTYLVLESEIYTTMNVTNKPERELERERFFTRYEQVPAAVLVVLSRARRGKLYDYARSIYTVSENVSRTESNDKKRWWKL